VIARAEILNNKCVQKNPSLIIAIATNECNTIMSLVRLKKRCHSGLAPIQINYFDQEQACAWIKKYHVKYLKKVSSCPHNRKHRTFHNAASFCKHLIDWTPEEKREFSKKLHALVSTCWSWRRLLVSGPTWNFILANDGLESGMPHTIHTAIVLPRWLVRTILFETSEPEAKRTAYETILHERIHVMQKSNPTHFSRLYKQWGWSPIEPGCALDQTIDAWESQGQYPTRYNPDTPNRWKCVKVHPNGTTTTWIPYVRMGQGGMRDARYMLAKLRVEQDNTVIPPSFVQWRVLDSVEWYTHFFGQAAHVYHPDESSAVLIAELMIRDTENSKIRSCPAVDSIIQWSQSIDT